MEITDVRIFLRNEPKLKAYVSITFDGCFVVHNMRVIDGKNGLFVAMPSKKRKDGKHQDLAHPITAEMRQKIEDLVISKYKEALESAPSAASGETSQPKPAGESAPLPESEPEKKEDSGSSEISI
ncbi:MAG: septation regulator SpoVG [Elusimicrobia bacterium]|nr:septation regulator SpoVG [Elusimicrobiota bacterium]